jgi:hypothetical protein
MNCEVRDEFKNFVVVIVALARTARDKYAGHDTLLWM